MANAKIVLSGSIDLTTLLDLAKKLHPSFSRSAKNGRVYANIQIWVNEEADQFKNDGSIKLYVKKADRDAAVSKFGKGYIGNVKISEADGPAPNADASDLSLDGFPGATPTPNAAGDGKITDDLPF